MGFPNNVITEVVKWLVGPLPAGVKLPSSLTDLPSVMGFGLQLLGLTWDNLAGRVTSRLSGGAQVVQRAIGFVQTALSGDAIGQLVNLVTQWVNDPAEQLSQLLTRIQNDFANKVVGELKNKAVNAAVDFATAFFPGGLAVIKAIYSAAQFAIQNAGTVAGLVGIAAGAVTAAATNSTRLVAEAVGPLIKKALCLLLGGLEKLPPFSAIIKTVVDAVRTAVRDLRCAIAMVVDKFVAWLVKLFNLRSPQKVLACPIQPMTCGMTPVSSGCGGQSGCFNPDTPVTTAEETKVPIAEMKAGVSRVPTESKHGGGGLLMSAPDGETWWLVKVVLAPEADASVRVEAELYRSGAWCRATEVRVGARVRLRPEDLDVAGWADVTSVTPADPPAGGPGRLVTATFKQSAAVVWDVQVEGEAGPIGVTPLHPVWSVDQHGWVRVGDLRVGERLLAQDGTTKAVLGLAARGGPEPVYNIEVEGDHCYRVGQQGLLVHNQSTPNPGGGTQQTAQCSCEDIVNSLRQTSPGRVTVTLLAQRGLIPEYLWDTACHLQETMRQAQRAAQDRQYYRSTTSVALVCYTQNTPASRSQMVGQFAIWYTNNYIIPGGGRHPLQGAFSGGRWLPPVANFQHAEEIILAEALVQRAIVVGIASSREICGGICQPALRRNMVELLSPEQPASRAGMDPRNVCLNGVPCTPSTSRCDP